MILATISQVAGVLHDLERITASINLNYTPDAPVRQELAKARIALRTVLRELVTT